MGKLNLTLDAIESKIDGIVLYEPIDLNILDKLLKSDLLKESFNSPFADRLYDNEKQQLLKYKSLIENGMARVKYEKVKGIKYGRVNPNKALGLFQIRRQIRHTLAKNTFIDIDIENCHPNLLLQICKANSVDCDYLEEYVSNRKMHLDAVMNEYNVTKDSAKKLFIQLMYFGDFNSWAADLDIKKERLPFINKFKKELQKIGEVIVKNNSKIEKLIEKRKDEQCIENYNKYGSVVSYFLQEYECRILESIFMYCKNKNIIKLIAVLCADGLMIPKESFKLELLENFSDLIKSKFGFELKFTVKEMNEDYLNILDDHVLSEDQLLKQELGNYDSNFNVDKKYDFQISKMTDLFFQDLKELGEDNYITNFQHSKSFKYFDFYHAHFYMSNEVRKIYMSSIQPYSKFGNSFSHLYFKHNKGKITFENLYLESRYKKMYSTYNFEPNSNNEEAMEVLDEWCKYSCIKECVTGDHYINNPPSSNLLLKGHRHDQSILAILRVRYNLPTVLKSTDLFEWRSLQDAIQNNSLFYVHHGNYIEIMN